MTYKCCECEEEFEELPLCLNCNGKIGIGEMICDNLTHYHYCSSECYVEAHATETELEEEEEEALTEN